MVRFCVINTVVCSCFFLDFGQMFLLFVCEMCGRVGNEMPGKRTNLNEKVGSLGQNDGDADPYSWSVLPVCQCHSWCWLCRRSCFWTESSSVRAGRPKCKSTRWARGISIFTRNFQSCLVTEVISGLRKDWARPTVALPQELLRQEALGKIVADFNVLNGAPWDGRRLCSWRTEG